MSLSFNFGDMSGHNKIKWNRICSRSCHFGQYASWCRTSLVKITTEQGQNNNFEDLSPPKPMRKGISAGGGAKGGQREELTLLSACADCLEILGTPISW